MGRNNSASAAKSRGQCKAGHNLTVQASSSGKNARMPMCTYGRACTRKGCIYKHPPKATSSEVDTTIPICKPFLAGACLYGKQCNNRHPPKKEVEKIVEKYLKTECRFGMSCQSNMCLYKHTPPPEPEPEPAPTLEPDGSGAVSADAGPDPRLARVRALLKARAQSIDAAAAGGSGGNGDGSGPNAPTAPATAPQPQHFRYQQPGSPPPPQQHASASFQPRFCPPDPGNPRHAQPAATMPGPLFGYGSTAAAAAAPALAPGGEYGLLGPTIEHHADVGSLSAAFGAQSLGGDDPILAAGLGPGPAMQLGAPGTGAAAAAAESSAAVATTTLSVGAVEFVPSWG